MASNGRTAAQVRSELESERNELAGAVEELRREVGKATDVKGMLRRNLPVATGAALGIGFVLAGGVGATMRLLARKGRESDEKARVGRFSIFQRDS
jgi:4-diphosphocytidyl-2C-methyl-D-erythritol kinase